MSGDGSLYVGSGSEITVLDGRTLERLRILEAPSSVQALAVSLDGARLYVGGLGEWRSSTPPRASGWRAYRPAT